MTLDKQSSGCGLLDPVVCTRIVVVQQSFSHEASTHGPVAQHQAKDAFATVTNASGVACSRNSVYSAACNDVRSAVFTLKATSRRRLHSHAKASDSVVNDRRSDGVLCAVVLANAFALALSWALNTCDHSSC